MVDEFVRQKGMQQRFHRRVWGTGIEQVDALEVHHVFIRQGIQRAQPFQRRQPHRGKAGGFDIAHVPARSLDAQDIDILAQLIADHRLDRCIAAAMQHQLRIGAQQPRGIDPQRHILIDAQGAITDNEILRFPVGPAGLHGLGAFSGFRKQGP